MILIAVIASLLAVYFFLLWRDACDTISALQSSVEKRCHERDGWYREYNEMCDVMAEIDKTIETWRKNHWQVTTDADQN